MEKIKGLFGPHHNKPESEFKKFLKFVGPGLLVTVGFIDPGNWASNIAAGSSYGYSLLWMVTLSTLMLIVLQHNAAHLGIVTGSCLSEAAYHYLPKKIMYPVLLSAVAASVATALAEILGGAIALQMLFGLPIKLGSILVTIFVIWILFSNSYGKLEKWIIGFVSIIGISFLFELLLVKVEFNMALPAFVIPSFPKGSMPIIMSVLGAVVMPHNLFLHSEIIQSREFHLEDESVIEKQLSYEFYDTLFSMIIGWAINSAMIILAAATFFKSGTVVESLAQAQELLVPLLGKGAGLVFALALLFAGLSSAITSGMAGGSIFAGMFGEPYNIKDKHSKVGVVGIILLSVVIIFFINNPFQGLVYSQMILSIQLPITIILQVYLTSSQKVMGKYKNTLLNKSILILITILVTILNVLLLRSFLV
ncbi:MAG: Nramp family divalent metal transporter [Clostridiaceae bacterium]